jgi:alkaline phosphatase D
VARAFLRVTIVKQSQHIHMTSMIPSLRFIVPATLAASAATAFAAVYQGNGIKVGEVTAESAVIWTRLTTAPEANWSGIQFIPPSIDGAPSEAVQTATAVARESGGSEALARAQKTAAPKRPISQAQLREIVLKADWRSQLPAGRTLPEMHGTLPGAAGAVRVVLTPEAGGAPVETPWAAVDPQRDFTRQFTVKSLRPGTRYHVRVESRDEKGGTGDSVEGEFRTAPLATAATAVKFGVITCADYPRRDDPARGHRVCDTLHRMRLDFVVHTGDVEYFDKPDPWATSAELARVKWNRLFALPFQRTFHNHTAVYFTNDDHDVLKNDCGPGQNYGALTFSEGIAIFGEQTPSSPLPYRTFRHGRDLQIWVIEGRRYRSANQLPDGPAKTILGPEQKAWLFRTLTESDATFKVLLTPTPIVGPDRGSKNDNHANSGFKSEGDELRAFLGRHKNLIVACGDRHWQYFSVDPGSGTREFGCGPMSDVHAGGYSPQPGDDAVQKFFRLKGGFLTVATDPGAPGRPQLQVQHHAVDGTVVHEVTVGADGGFRIGSGRGSGRNLQPDR